MSVSLEQPMREAEIELIKLANANEAAIAQEVQDRIAADTTFTNDLASEISTREAQYTQLHSDIEDTNSTVNELGSSLNTLNTTVGSIGDLEFGTSNSFSVQGSSYQDVDVTFTTKTKEPIVLCGLQHATGNLNCVVTAVTNQQFSVRVYNLTTTDVSDVTLDWLTISGR